MKFSYRGFDKAGQPAKGAVEASTREEATEALLARGVYVSDLREGAEGAAGAGGGVPRFGAGKRLMQVSSFLRQLSVLVGTGMPLVEAIASLEKQAPQGAWKSVLSRVRERVEEGAPLSEAMAAHPAYFDGVCRSLIAAGESGGKLDAMLQRLAVFLRQQVRIRKTVTGAMAYPCLLTCVALVVVVAMLGFVMPRFEGLFKTIDVPLPPTTKVLMSASGFIREYWYGFATAGVLLPVGLWLWMTTRAGVRAWERVLMGLPALGPLAKSFATARIARVLGVLLEGRVTMLDALRLTRASAGREAYAALLQRAEDAVTRGDNISTAFTDATLVNPSVCEAIRSGEKTGKIGPVLLHLADHLDEDNDSMLKTVTGLLEPAILIAMGLIVGVMAVSMFLPLFDLAASGGRH